MTTRPDASAPCTWKTFFARSNPIVQTSFMDVLQCRFTQTHHGTLRPPGGVYIIRTERTACTSQNDHCVSVLLLQIAAPSMIFGSL